MLRQCPTYIKTVLMPISLVEQRIKSKFEGDRQLIRRASASGEIVAVYDSRRALGHGRGLVADLEHR